MTVVDMSGDGRDDLWIEVIELARHLDEWVLVGGLMVSLWARSAGIEMQRTTDDIDTLFRAETYLQQPQRSVEALRERGYQLADNHPVDVGDGQGAAFRFERFGIKLDVLVPDKFRNAPTPVHTVGSYSPSFVPGGSYALRHTEAVAVTCGTSKGIVPLTSVIGGLLMKRRAQQVDTSVGRARHGQDLAVLWASLADPLRVEVSTKERKLLRAAAEYADWSVLDAEAAATGRTAADLLLAT